MRFMPTIVRLIVDKSQLALVYIKNGTGNGFQPSAIILTVNGQKIHDCGSFLRYSECKVYLQPDADSTIEFSVEDVTSVGNDRYIAESNQTIKRHFNAGDIYRVNPKVKWIWDGAQFTRRYTISVPLIPERETEIEIEINQLKPTITELTSVKKIAEMNGCKITSGITQTEQKGEIAYFSVPCDGHDKVYVCYFGIAHMGNEGFLVRQRSGGEIPACAEDSN